MPQEHANVVAFASRSRQSAEREEQAGEPSPESRLYGAIEPCEFETLVNDGYGAANGWEGRLPAEFL